MAFHRCKTGFVVGIDDDRDFTFSEGKAYDDGDPQVAAAIARFPDRFDSPAKATK